ncbi:MAG TPA: hypothetical protein VMM12_05585 [Longimicrobiales bacterium]|nr:hypothetical protein [Longimicrobiales bacterium]
MSWKQWTAVALVAGVGIVLQIPEHRDQPTEGHSHAPVAPTAPSPDESVPNPFRTVVLEVTGMT